MAAARITRRTMVFLFFDGETFRRERLHRAVKRLKHRPPSESAAAAAGSTMMTSPPASASIETHSPPIGKIAKMQVLSKSIVHPVGHEVERIDIGERESPGQKPMKRNIDCNSAPQNPFSHSPEPKTTETDDNIEIDIDDDGDVGTQTALCMGFDTNLPSQMETDPDEIADVDADDDILNAEPNAAEALRAQVNAEGGQKGKDMLY